LQSLKKRSKKHKDALREKGAKLIGESGLLDLPISEKDLKKELKNLLR
jgi:hypothetical protein